jgi:hypothetical protein
MTSEEMQRTMDFILNEQAKTAASLEMLAQAQAEAVVREQQDAQRTQKADERIARLERLMILTIRAGRRERHELRDRINALVNAQTHTEDVLTEFVETTEEKFTALAESQREMQAAMERLARRSEESERSQIEMRQAMTELSRIVARHDQQLNGSSGD